MVGDSIDEGTPGSVQSIVQSRMDRPGPPDRAALEAASVLGQRFSGEALSALLEGGEGAFEPLLQKGLIRPEDDGFLFAHDLVRDGVYATLLQERRRSLHAAAAAWFEQRDATLYAQHLRGADDPGAAAAFLHAAESYSEQHRLEAALRLLEDGLATSQRTGSAPGVDHRQRRGPAQAG